MSELKAETEYMHGMLVLTIGGWNSMFIYLD